MTNENNIRLRYLCIFSCKLKESFDSSNKEMSGNLMINRFYGYIKTEWNKIVQKRD